MGLSDAAVLPIFYRINDCVGQDNLWVSLTLLFYRYFIGLMSVGQDNLWVSLTLLFYRYFIGLMIVLGRIIYGSL